MESPDQRLDSLATHWSLVERAHVSDQDVAICARRELVNRYKNPIFRYALACLRNEDAAGEILQQFAVLVMEGKLHRASPEKGRLRKYIKTVVLNLIRKSTAQKHTSLPEQFEREEKAENDHFATCCRAELLATSTQALIEENFTQGNLIKLKAALPNSTSTELAEEFTKQFEPITAPYVRKSVQRGLPKLANILFGNVKKLADSEEPEVIRAELVELNLWNYCQEPFSKWAEQRDA